jgi:hypothetical protein
MLLTLAIILKYDKRTTVTLDNYTSVYIVIAFNFWL